MRASLYIAKDSFEVYSSFTTAPRIESELGLASSPLVEFPGLGSGISFCCRWHRQYCCRLTPRALAQRPMLDLYGVLRTRQIRPDDRRIRPVGTSKHLTQNLPNVAFEEGVHLRCSLTLALVLIREPGCCYRRSRRPSTPRTSSAPSGPDTPPSIE